MPTGQAGGELTLGAGAPVAFDRVAAGPSRPQSAMREGAIAWRLLGLLSLNYLSLVDSSPKTAPPRCARSSAALPPGPISA